MMIPYEGVGAFCAFLTVCGGIFHFAVIRPLENSIAELKKEIEQLRKDRERMHLLEIKITEVEQRVRSNQHRITALEAKS